MRLFEVVLLALNALGVVSFTASSRRVRLALAGLHVLVFLIHSVVEGLRYQLSFAYLFTACLVIFVLANPEGVLANTRVPRVLVVGLQSVVGALLIGTAFLAYALPVFTLPKPTGDYPVGLRYLYLVDVTRTDPFLNPTTHYRELMVKVYYPAASDDTKSFAAYFDGSGALTRAFAAFYQMPDFAFDHLTLVKTWAKKDLAIAAAPLRFPVVLVSHGAGATMEVLTSLCEDLASRGYVVIAIDHPYVSAATVFPDRIVTAQQATTRFDTPEPAEPITQIMADDVVFVMDSLDDIDVGNLLPELRGRLDLDKIGVAGHSVGGAVAYQLVLDDDRVKAALNLDGVVYVSPRDPTGVPPFLMLANDQYHVQAIEHGESLLEEFPSTPEGQGLLLDIYGSREAYEAAQAKARANVAGLIEVLVTSDALYTIDGCDHQKFTDIGLFIGSPWLRELLQIRGATDPARCLVIAQALTVAFFDHALNRQSADLVRTIPHLFPELRHIRVRPGQSH